MSGTQQKVRIVSVLSGKGGVGKSVVVVNLAERLAFQGQRVLMVDADFNCGSLHILTKVKTEYGVAEFMSERLSLAEAVMPAFDGCDLLASIANTDLSRTNSVDEAVRFLTRLRQESVKYDLVLIDHSSGVSDAATAMAHGSDLSILLMVPELTSISNCYGLARYLTDPGGNIECRILLNRCRDDEEANYVAGKFSALSKRFLGRVFDSIGNIPESSRIRRSIIRQQPVAQIEPQSEVAHAFTILAENLQKSLDIDLSVMATEFRKPLTPTNYQPI